MLSAELDTVAGHLTRLPADRQRNIALGKGKDQDLVMMFLIIRPG